MKQKLHFAFIIFFFFLFFSCKQKGEKQHTASYHYSLKETDRVLTYESEEPLGINFSALFPFTDKNGNKYLTFQETSQNKISFYEMFTGKHFKTLEIEREGPNGITQLIGYYIRDLDEIYLTNPNLPMIAKTDTTGDIFEKINFEKTDDGKFLIPSFKSTHFSPLVIINDTFYITQVPYPGKEPDTCPVSCYIDTLHKSVGILPFNFPLIIKGNEIRTTGLGIELSYSRCFDGSNFIYSFYYEEQIRVMSPDHTEMQQIPVKSKYIKKINNTKEIRPSDMYLGAKRLCEAPFYSNLIYDHYRNIYYRVAYPETEMEDLDGKTYIDVWTTGRKCFSIIILDKNFNIIGETLFPDYTYYSKHIFVEENGLYIRNNHFMNPDFKEDKLFFTCFELKKE